MNYDFGGRVVLVFGGRNYEDRWSLYTALDNIHSGTPIGLVIEGDAGGADRFGGDWARSREVPWLSVPAKWGTHQKAAGPYRNSRMRDMRPDLGVQCPGGYGTADMRGKLDVLGIPVVEVE